MLSPLFLSLCLLVHEVFSSARSLITTTGSTKQRSLQYPSGCHQKMTSLAIYPHPLFTTSQFTYSPCLPHTPHVYSFQDCESSCQLLSKTKGCYDTLRPHLNHSSKPRMTCVLRKYCFDSHLPLILALLQYFTPHRHLPNNTQSKPQCFQK